MWRSLRSRNVVAVGVGVVVSLAVSAYAPHALACSCAEPQAPVDELGMADAVFEGYAVAADTDPQRLKLFVSFQVLRSWKGVAADRVVEVETAALGASCGVPVAVGETMLVYARYIESRLVMGACSRTARSADAAEDFAALGAPAETGTAAPGSLSPPPKDDPPQATDGGCAVGGRGASAGSLAVFLTVLLVQRRRRPGRPPSRARGGRGS